MRRAIALFIALPAVDLAITAWRVAATRRIMWPACRPTAERTWLFPLAKAPIADSPKLDSAAAAVVSDED
jgi:hypothetical protein